MAQAGRASGDGREATEDAGVWRPRRCSDVGAVSLAGPGGGRTGPGGGVPSPVCGASQGLGLQAFATVSGFYAIFL